MKRLSEDEEQIEIAHRVAEPYDMNTSESLLEGTLSDTAFLVNVLRARDVEISKDIYAELWTTERSWQITTLYLDALRGYNGKELALRNQLFLQAMGTFTQAYPDSVLVNLGAGFTSYPFLLDPANWIEVDLPKVISFKQEKVARMIAEGRLPKRSIEFLSFDLDRIDSIELLPDTLSPRLEDRPSFILLEGLSYYLSPHSLDCLFSVIRQLQVKNSVLALDYWPSRLAQTPALQDMFSFFDKQFGCESQEYNFIETSRFESLEGYEVIQRTDAQELARSLGREAGEQEIQNTFPEHHVTLRRR